MRKVAVGSFSVILLLGACTVGPDYTPPEIEVPASYGSPQDRGVAPADIAAWWTGFGDPVLDGMIARALADNLDLRQAAARVRQARAQEAATRHSGDPQVNANGQAGYNRLSENALPSGLSALGGGSGSGGSALGLPGEGFTTFQAGFDASWEVDLSGGQRRANEAAGARTTAAIWSQRDAQVTLTAEVANSYQQYRALQRRIALTDQMIAAQRELLDFTRVRTENGLVTTLDERRQQGEIEQLAAQRADMAAQAQARVHALGTLLGLAPTALAVELAGPPPAATPAIEVPPGLPSDLLQRRPDIRAAERQMAAANAEIGVATADLYPRISLTGALQLASRALGNLLESDSLQANGAGRLSMPLLGRGSKKATVRVREAQAEESRYAYQARVMGALKDVEDALTRLDADRTRAAHLQAAEAAARDAADTAGVRFRNGLVTSLDVLEARRTLLSARDAVTQAQAATVQDVVALYKALGGGWDERRINEKEEPNGRGE